MRKTTCLIVILTAGLIKCTPEPQSKFQDVNAVFTIESFKEQKKLFGSKIDLGTVLSPVFIFFHDSLLFVTTIGLERNIFIYNSNDNFSSVGSIISRGFGPDELLSVVRMDFNSNGTFWTHDAVSAKLKRFETKRMNDSLYAIAHETVSLNGPTPNAFLLGNQIGVTTQEVVPLTRFYVYDMDGKRTKETGDYPSYERDIPATAKVEVYNAWAGIHPDRNQFILAYEYTDLLEFYNEDFELTKRIQGPHLFVPEFELKDRGGHQAMKRRFDLTKYAYQTVVCSDSLIFLLYDNGETVSKDDNQDEAGHFSTLVAIDWNGQPLSVYELDHPVISICVDWHKRVIYGLDRIESEVYAFPF
ncbi:MAG TPA: BF3164 family lipoprotein [Cyclobacteriaceae bacterium]|jgi:hypothetical protein|nr:BF3164 family lipoprotein [Cyclobacteriaceae bacterium]